MKTLSGARGRSAPRSSLSLARLGSASLGLLAVAVLANCGAGGENKTPESVQPLAPMLPNGRTGDGTASGGTFVPDDCTGPSCDIADTSQLPAPPGCGNGSRDMDEACDDGNTSSGDGCASNCLANEPGFSCPTPGQPCRKIVVCGDSLQADTEQCDDGNTTNGDGCSARCRVELGKKCSGTPSVCTNTTCGDRIIEGAEACDDGNTLPFDGCSATCQKEPDCSTGNCTSECGDGLVLNEQCDDGNLIEGDGCSPQCTIESGFVCPQAACETLNGDPNGECILRAAAIFRDFDGEQPDFGDNSCQFLTLNTVLPRLDAQGRPVLNAANTAALQQACLTQSTPTTFSQWYTSGANNVPVVGDLVLFANGQGGYTNRWGADGTKWSYTAGQQRQAQGGCEAGCLNEAQNGQGPLFQGQGALRCADNCRMFTDQAQQQTNGPILQLTQQLNQAMAANPPVQATIDDLTTRLAAAQATLDALNAQGAQCLATCQADLDERMAICTPTCLPCRDTPNQTCLGGQIVEQDGTPLFFPVDDVQPRTYYSPGGATIPEQYGYPSFPPETTLFPGAGMHNFYFTTEVEYWFQYTADMQARLTFIGDDDVWVFINGNLAVDLGGLHVPSTGYVEIDAPAGRVTKHVEDGRTTVANLVDVTDVDTPNDFGLTPGNVYKISIFHAERQLTGSSFQLTLAGFDAQPSTCTADCGDGILSFGEECDNGRASNVGGYGECDASCKLGPFCGDRNVDTDFGETCDVGPGGDGTCRGCRTFTLR